MRNLKGIPESKYICATCKQEKDSIEFHWYAQTIDGRGRGGNGIRKRVNGSCKDCRSKLQKQTTELKKKTLPDNPRPAYGEFCKACKDLRSSSENFISLLAITFSPYYCL